MQSLKEKYNKEVVPEMMKKLGYKNRYAVPSIRKVVLNSSFGKAIAGWAQGWVDRGNVLSDVTAAVAEGSMTVDVSAPTMTAIGQ